MVMLSYAKITHMQSLVVINMKWSLPLAHGIVSGNLQQVVPGDMGVLWVDLSFRREGEELLAAQHL